jgi:hypothetical protein
MDGYLSSAATGGTGDAGAGRTGGGRCARVKASMRGAIGTLEWARRTGGRMSRRDRWAMVRQGAELQLALLASGLRRRLGGGAARLDLGAVRVPDSAAAREAEALCHAAASASLANHCDRAYLWGALLAQAGRIPFDEELLYVACQLHDLGLTERFFGVHPGVHCFAVEGARVAEEWAAERGWAEERKARLAEALSLHLNVRVALRHGPEAHLLHEGTSLDVTGLRAWEIARGLRQEVVVRYPRLGFKREIDALAQVQRQARPGCRIDDLYRRFGFGKRVARAPFAE